MTKKYPTEKDIREHKDRLWTAIVQHFAGLVPLTNVQEALKILMGDATLWVNNNLKEGDTYEYVEEMKRKIAKIVVIEQ